jgi:hypothetical protein
MESHHGAHRSISLATQGLEIGDVIRVTFQPDYVASDIESVMWMVRLQT